MRARGDDEMLKEGYVEVTGGHVWYQIVGNETKTPVILLHGGPGFTHFSMLPLSALAEERPVVFYDQLGSGHSERPNDLSLWHIDRFVEELGQLRDALGLAEVHILGHSWGGMLAASYLLTKPKGVKSAVFSSPCLSAHRWCQDQAFYRKQLPRHVQDVLDRCEQESTTGSEEYEKAMLEYYKRHYCRLDPWPNELIMDFKHANMEVYRTMWGPAEFYATGNLKDFDCTSRLHEIKIPVLFTCGRFDEATPETTSYYATLVHGAKFHVFEKSGHMSYLEETDEYLRVVKEFLANND
jgi:proline iminopeptidase